MYIASLVITKKERVYCMVRTAFLNVIYVKFTYKILAFFESYLLEVYRWYFFFFWVSFAKLLKAIISFVMSVCLSVCLSFRLSVRLTAWNNSALAGRIFMKFNIWVLFQNLSRKFIETWQESWTLYMKTYVHLLLISRLILLRIKKFSDKRCREN
jgi:hypothetical protein